MKRKRPRVQRPPAISRGAGRDCAARLVTERIAPYTTTLVASALPPCPWCGAPVAADATTGAVVHGLPMCERFRRLNPMEFLTAMREELEARIS